MWSEWVSREGSIRAFTTNPQYKRAAAMTLKSAKSRIAADLLGVLVNPKSFVKWFFEPFLKDFPSWETVCLLGANALLLRDTAHPKDLILGWVQYLCRSVYRTWLRERRGHAEFWKAWNSEKSWIRKVLVLEFTPFLYFNRFVERVPFMVHLFSFALAFGPFLDLPLWAYLALWAYALECVVVCAGHRYSPFVKKGLEWMTFGPKNLKFFLGNPGSVGIRGAAWGFSVYALYKYELHKYNEERKGVLNDAIIHAQLSAKVAMQSLPENVDPEASLKVYNTTFKETLQAIMSDWDSANYPWPRWRKSATFESDSTTFKATQDSAGNTTLEGKYQGTPKAPSNRGFAGGGLEEGKK